MIPFIDLVSVADADGTIRVVQAPAWSHLRRGERVMVEETEHPSEVLTSMTVNTDNEMLDFIRQSCSMDNPPKRVTQILRYENVVYKDEEDDT